ncbi:putative protein OS=Streptomyces aurantiogriseus OX=66870 GN=GCM10010251_53230 PE=4 SV=1 [Streptomyces aurantiogriseus]|uniref:Uncharacterized protein n=1 Tax=Streptomyces aurantiogriseus TaxID=66870 RepID=A0A918CM82_9ACTN|nr:hypothetical protein GCM10010251_53230 [Streptomyces aurantiogriseus]
MLKPLALRHLAQNRDADPGAVARRILDTFAEAAGLDRERVHRWAQFHLVQTAFHGRRHGFRVARGGPALDLLTQYADRLAQALTARLVL